MIINRIYETQSLLSLYLVSFLVGLRTYQHPSTYLVMMMPRGLKHVVIISFRKQYNTNI